MNWKRIILWVGLALAIWFISMMVAGLIFGLINPQAKEQPIIFGLAGMLVPFLFFITASPFIFGLLTIAITIWSEIAKRLPVIESSLSYLLLWLGGYSILIGVVFWLLFPFERELAAAGGILTILGLIIPRLVSKKLAPGVFSA